MAKFVEMDQRVKFKDQIEQKMIGSGILINKFNVKSNKIEQFLKDWAKDAANFKQQPGLFLHNYIKELEKVVYLLITQFGNR